MPKRKLGERFKIFEAVVKNPSSFYTKWSHWNVGLAVTFLKETHVESPLFLNKHLMLLMSSFPYIPRLHGSCCTGEEAAVTATLAHSRKEGGRHPDLTAHNLAPALGWRWQDYPWVEVQLGITSETQNSMNCRLGPILKNKHANKTTKEERKHPR